jgi:hypothetical protein
MEDNQNQNQEQFEMISEEHAQYLARIASIPVERLEAIRAAQDAASARFHAARRVLEKLRAWRADYAIFPLERLEEVAERAREIADAKAAKAAGANVKKGA